MKKSLENFHPRLRPGRVTPQGATIIFETDSPYNQITLPMALADLILLCSGHFSVREIVEKIYRKQGSVPFKSLLRAIEILHQGGFFENGDELILSPHLRSWMDSNTNRWELSWRVKDRLIMTRKWPLLFYVLTLFFVVGGIFGLQSAPASILHEFYLWFQKQSLWLSLLSLFACSSALQSLRYLGAGVQTFLLTGRIYNISACLSPWGIHLKVGDEVADGLANRLYITLFHGSQILFGWFLVWVGSFFLPTFWSQGMVLASLLLTVWELNPFVESEWRKMVRGLLIQFDRDSMAMQFESGKLMNFVSHESRRRENDFAMVCAIWGTFWLVAIFTTIHKSAESFGPAILAEILHSPASAWMEFGGLVAWLAALYMATQTLVETLFVSFLLPYRQQLRLRFWNKKDALSEIWSQERLMEELEKLPLFSHIHEENLAALVKAATVVEHMPSSIIMAESEPARDIYVLLDGELEISRSIKGRQMRWITPLSAIAVFGEAALNNEEAREDEARAKTQCVVLKVPIYAVKLAANSSQSIRQIEDFRMAILVSQFFASSPVFRSLSSASIEYLSHRGSLEYFEPGQKVFQQGDQPDGLYLTLRGSVNVMVHGKLVTKLTQGSFFGEIGLIANIPRTATIEIVEPSIFFKISADAFWSVLVQHMDLGVFIETISEARLKADLEFAPEELRKTGSDS